MPAEHEYTPLVFFHPKTERRSLPVPTFVNRRLAYVAVSRGRYDAQIYTNDKTNLGETLGRDLSHRSAMEPTRAAGPAVAQQIGPASSLSQATQQAIEQGLTMSR